MWEQGRGALVPPSPPVYLSRLSIPYQTDHNSAMRIPSLISDVVLLNLCVLFMFRFLFFLFFFLELELVLSGDGSRSRLYDSRLPDWRR